MRNKITTLIGIVCGILLAVLPANAQVSNPNFWKLNNPYLSPILGIWVPSSTSYCLSGDCRSVWPSGGGSVSGTPGQVAVFANNTSSVNGFPTFVYDTSSRRLQIGGNGSGDLDASQGITIQNGNTGTNALALISMSNDTGNGFSLIQSGSNYNNDPYLENAMALSEVNNMFFAASNSIYFNTGSNVPSTTNERAIITKAGKFGIGTHTPATLLDVNGTLNVNATTTLTTTTLLNITGSSQCIHVNANGTISGTGMDCSVSSGSVGTSTINYFSVYDTANSVTGTPLLTVTGTTLLASGGAIMASGTTGGTPGSGAGTRMMWIPAKAAFRVGKVTNTNWDNVNIGFGSFAAGQNVRAQGTSSIALGDSSNAVGTTAIALGDTAHANANQSIAIGGTVTASSLEALAMGIFSTASGTGAISIGTTNNAANGDFSTAIGATAVTNGQGAVAIGQQTSANSDYAVALGLQSTVNGTEGLAIGLGAVSNGLKAVSIGNANNANGEFSTAMGTDITVSGSGSFGIGLATTTALTLSLPGTFGVLGGNAIFSSSTSFGKTTAPGFTIDDAGTLNVVGASTLGATTITGKNVCLSDGTNCPASSGVSTTTPNTWTALNQFNGGLQWTDATGTNLFVTNATTTNLVITNPTNLPATSTWGTATKYFTVTPFEFGGFGSLGTIPLLSANSSDFAAGSDLGAIANKFIIADTGIGDNPQLIFAPNNILSTGLDGEITYNTTTDDFSFNKSLTINGALTIANTSTFNGSGIFNGNVGIGTSTPDNPFVVTGHTEYVGPLTSISSCGTSPTSTGNDSMGTFIAGTGNPLSCTLNFATAWTKAPVCIIDSNISLNFTKTITTSTLTISSISFLNNDKFDYFCAISKN